MYRIFTLIILIPSWCASQILEYSPNFKVDKVVSEDYYDTDFIYVKNNTTKSLSVDFELLENTFLNEWSESVCTNVQCFNTIPNGGTLGTLQSNGEGFVSLNFSSNQTLGEGKVILRITSPENPSLSDTLSFQYQVTEGGKLEAKPWVKINHQQGMLTVFLDNPFLSAHMKISGVNGALIFDQQLEAITSIPLRDFASGIYVISIIDEQGRAIKETIAQP